jgi:transposase
MTALMSMSGLMDITASAWGGASALGSRLVDGTLSGADSKRSRRSWSPEEKRRILGEAACPGASVAAVARRHGLNANLVFAWRRALQPATAVSAEAARGPLPACPKAPPSAVDAPEFVPIGVFTRADDGGPGLRVPAAPAAAAMPGPLRTTRPVMDERLGVIEIDLADGTRLRVDAFVNERALRRVLAALRAAP